MMAIASVTVKEWSVSTTRYNIFVLLSVFGVYIYRDIWPLATFTKEPKDLQEGYLLWIKFTITTLTTVVIPLFIPRQYVPIDPKVQKHVESVTSGADKFRIRRIQCQSQIQNRHVHSLLYYFIHIWTRS